MTNHHKLHKCQFPEGFFWGAATSSYQVEEGITNTDWYKGFLDKKVPSPHHGPAHNIYYEKDYDLARELGHNAHRISIEWAKVEPVEGDFDEEAVLQYKKMVKALKQRGIEPFVTMWHFSLPMWFVNQGGFRGKKGTYFFARYCAKMAKELYPDCTHFATINEPIVYISNGWMRGNWPPFKAGRIIGVIMQVRALAKAHKEAYLEIKKLGHSTEVGIVKDNIYFHSNKNWFNKLRVHYFRYLWNFLFLDLIEKYTDSIGLNYYFHSYFGDKKIEYAKSDMGWDIFPEGLYHTLVELKRYNKPVFVAECGIADEDDKYRGQYIIDCVSFLYKAIQDGVPLKGFMYWSLLDNYEWALGYEKKFGLIAFDSESKKRKVRESAYVYKKICQNNGLIIEEK